ncbi:MAG: hypothetical protein ACK4N5_06075, partial [Myxococcales bacterium]
MDRALLLCSTLALTAGCFQPVEVAFDDPDAGTAAQDAGKGACSGDADCTQPPANGCKPRVAVCASGVCVVKDADPARALEQRGACEQPSDCDCQDLPHEKCAGSWSCTAGKCAWQCGQACTTGLQKPCGTSADCGSANYCKAGCCQMCPVYDAAPCPPERRCTKPGGVDENGCPLPPICVPCGGCESDKECGKGEICDEDSQCGISCVPGCRSDADCASGEYCYGGGAVCDACGCSTPRCMKKVSCATDRDCPPNAVCEPGPDCASGRTCVVGCRKGTRENCGPGQLCMALGCFTCPCPDTCVSDPDCFDGDGDG